MSGGRDLGFAFALLWIRLTVLARAAHAHGGVLLSTGPQPLTQNRGKSEKQNFPITPGKEEERGEGAAKTPIPRMGGWRRGERVGGRRAEGGRRSSCRRSRRRRPRSPFRAPALHRPTGDRLLPPLSIAGQGRSCKHFANSGEDDEMSEPFSVYKLLKDGIFEWELWYDRRMMRGGGRTR